MNSDHAAGGLVGTPVGAALVAVIAASFHIDPTLASNWVVVGTAAGGSLIALIIWWVRWKYPQMPPLPGEIVALPADGGPAVPAVPAQVLPAPPLPPVPPPAIPAIIQPGG